MTKTTLTESNNPLFFIRFGDPEPVLQSAVDLYDAIYQHAYLPYYKPPIDLMGLFKMTRANPYHGSILHFQKNMLTKWYKPHKKLPFDTFERLCLDFRIYGQFHAQRIKNKLGGLIRLEHLPTVNMRKHLDDDVYIKLLNRNFYQEQFITFRPGEVVSQIEYDGLQTIYGCPEYIGGLQSVLLNEASTLFRRKVFEKNGQHIGYVLVTTDANIDEDTAKKIKNEITNTSGPANMYINIPRSSNNRQPVQVVPLGNIESKDSYEAIQGITERQALAMHRTPPVLAGIIPADGSSFGNVAEMKNYYHEFEVESMQKTFLALNESEGEEIVNFELPSWRLIQIA